MAEEKFQSIYGDAASEFEIEDVSDETLSISKEEIEEKIEEQSKDEEPAEEPAPVEEETPKEEEPAEEEPAPAEESHEEEGQTSEPEEEQEIEGVTFEDHAVQHHDEDDELGYRPIEDHPREDQEEDHDEDADDHDDDHVSVISYILHAILFTIPVIGTILMLVYIISDNKNEHLRHFAQIWLITLLIIAIGAYAALTILGIA